MQRFLSAFGKVLLMILISEVIVCWASITQAQEIIVSTATELADAVAASIAGDTILLEDGVYPLSASGTIAVRTTSLTIRGRSGARAAVVVEGWGMHAHDHNG